MCTHCGCSSEKASFSDPSSGKHTGIALSTDRETIKMQHALLAGNDRIAKKNRQYFQQKGITCINLMGTPGAGKTHLLESLLKSGHPLFRELPVFEGDQESSNDARRVIQAGGKALQINTGVGCHLDAEMIGKGLQQFPPTASPWLFIENVGNLVCPALFDLGESTRIAMMAITDGEDKPIKYPHMFSQCDLVLINKIDLLPYVDFNMEKVLHDLSHLNPAARVIPISARTGEGMDELFTWFEEQGRYG